MLAPALAVVNVKTMFDDVSAQLFNYTAVGLSEGFVTTQNVITTQNVTNLLHFASLFHFAR